jgi:hypothetical protein
MLPLIPRIVECGNVGVKGMRSNGCEIRLHGW